MPTNNNRRHLINVHSSVKGKVPGVDAADMRYGEIAVNHSKGNAFLSTRVSDTEMELFPSIKYIEQYPFSSLTVNGLTTLSGTTKIEKVEAGDKTFDYTLSETSVNAVQNKAVTKVIQENEKITSASLNELNDRKLDASAYTPTDLSDYYKMEETSGKTELDTAFGLKANAADLTAHIGDKTVHITSDERTKWDNATTTLASHTGDSTVHITADERTKWNNADANSHTHANKDVLDAITAIDTSLSATSNNLVVNSAITKVIQDNEQAVSASLNDLNDRIRKIHTHANLETLDKITDIDTELNKESSNLVVNSAITTAIQANEQAVSASLNDLNDKIKKIHTHANKSILDAITGIDTALSETSNNLVVNSAITKVIQDMEETISSSLNDLNKRITIMEAEISALKTDVSALKNKS